MKSHPAIPLYVLAALCLLLVSACDRERGREAAPLEARIAQPAEHLVGAAAASLGSDGQFSAYSLSTAARPALNEEEAVRLAERYVVSNWRHIRLSVERVHGTTVDPARLRRMGRVVAAETPHVPLPEEFPNPVHKAFGPYYIVTLGAGGVPVALVAVSAYATDVTIENSGALRYVGPEKSFGNEFFVSGIGRDGRGAMLMPEAAASIAYSSTGVRIAGQPRFYRYSGQHAPNLGVWHIQLETAATLNARGQGAPRMTHVVYVDNISRDLLIPTGSPRPEIVTRLRGGPAQGEQTLTAGIGWRQAHGTALMPAELTR